MAKKPIPVEGKLVLTYPSGRIEEFACKQFDKKYQERHAKAQVLIEGGSLTSCKFERTPSHELGAAKHMTTAKPGDDR